MFKKFLAISLMALVFGLVPATSPVQAESTPAISSFNAAGSTTAVARRYGPYATLRRANEVANYARRYGYSAKIIYSSIDYTRVYYVDVW